MDFELWFYILFAFLVGRTSMLTFYIGTDKEKYAAADVAILLRIAA